MKAEERAKKLSKCAGNLEECDGLENLYVFAVEQIRQAEAATRAEEREACALAADSYSANSKVHTIARHGAVAVADLIRARKTPEDETTGA